MTNVSIDKYVAGFKKGQSHICLEVVNSSIGEKLDSFDENIVVLLRLRV